MKTIRAAIGLAASLAILACAPDDVQPQGETDDPADDGIGAVVSSGSEPADGSDGDEVGQTAAALTSGVATKVVYGSSAEGQKLLAYKLAPARTNGKIAFLTFGLHGYEDAFEHDGRALYSIAHKLIAHYSATPADLRQWTVWIIPSANPDGMRRGKNNFREGTRGAYGRCTSEAQDLNRQFSSSTFAEHDALKQLVDKVKPSAVIDFHGWYNCYYGKSRVGRHFADAFNAPYAGKPSRYCFTGSNGKMDCGAQLGGVFHENTTISDDLFAEWASSERGIPAALVEYPSPDLNENGIVDAVFDEKLGHRRMVWRTVDIFAKRTRVGLDLLFRKF